MELNKAQKEAVAVYTGNCEVIAAAGSGKTKVLVARMINLITKHGINPDNILAITFNKKSRDNISTRFSAILPDANVHIETFHSLGYKIVKRFVGQFELITYNWQKQKIFNDICGDPTDKNHVNDFFLYVATRKNNLLKPGEKSHEYPLDPLYDNMYGMYEHYKKSAGLMDYDDLLTQAYNILCHNNVALDYYRNKFKFILVDEMQDINKAQYEVIKIINAHGNLFVVGDALQNIYSWRGSNNMFMLDFKRDFPDAKIINMNINYRSSKNIVDFANFFASHLPEAKSDIYKPSVAFKPAGEQVQFHKYKNEDMEANHIASWICDNVSQDKYSYKNIAILSRTNAQLLNFETAFHDKHIPYQIVGGISFVNRKEIKIVLSYLRLAENSTDDGAFKYIFNKPNRYLGKAFLESVSQYAAENKLSLFKAMDKFANTRRWSRGILEIKKAVSILQNNNFTDVSKQISELRKVIGLDNYIAQDLTSDEDDSDRIAAIDNLQFMAQGYKRRCDFLKYIKGISTTLDKADTVKLSTIHKAKGLEWPVVFFIDLNDGIIPHKRSNDICEEARLAYVAITRAMDKLYCSSTLSLHGKDMNKSPFLKIMFKK